MPYALHAASGLVFQSSNVGEATGFCVHVGIAYNKQNVALPQSHLCCGRNLHLFQF